MPERHRLAPVRVLVHLVAVVLRLPLSILRVLFVGLALGLAPPPPGVKVLRHDDDVVQVDESRQETVEQRT
jgi:hypothetical protein